jgi:hypothetical protein
MGPKINEFSPNFDNQLTQDLRNNENEVASSSKSKNDIGIEAEEPSNSVFKLYSGLLGCNPDPEYFKTQGEKFIEGQENNIFTELINFVIETTFDTFINGKNDEVSSDSVIESLLKNYLKSKNEDKYPEMTRIFSIVCERYPNLAKTVEEFEKYSERGENNDSSENTKNNYQIDDIDLD